MEVTAAAVVVAIAYLRQSDKVQMESQMRSQMQSRKSLQLQPQSRMMRQVQRRPGRRASLGETC